MNGNVGWRTFVFVGRSLAPCDIDAFVFSRIGDQAIRPQVLSLSLADMSFDRPYLGWFRGPQRDMGL